MESQRHCPHDHSVLHPEMLHSVQIDRCPECSGVWLEKGELEALQELAAATGEELDAPNEVNLAFSMAKEKERPVGTCPVCEAELDRSEYLRGSQVLAEVCAQGHGLWLDAGELITLEAFFVAQRREVEEEEHSLRHIWGRMLAFLRGEE